VIEDHESAASRDILSIIGGTPYFQPLDLGLKLAEPGVYVVWEFVSRLVLLR
jgi:hypothetical protein